MMSGEYGYSDQVGTSNYTPDSVIAKYIPRVFEVKINEGFNHLFYFQMCGTSTNFTGAKLRSTCTAGVADPVLPQFTAFQSYVAHHRDSGVSPLTPIYYNASSATSTVQFGKLSQFSDGRYSLPVWNEVASAQHGTGVLINVPVVPAKLVLAPQYNPHDGTVTTFDANGFLVTTPFQFTRNADGSSEYDPAVTDSVSLLEFYAG
jgi:hypothetical protein